jgi:serine phosphatase RsbU (regulator of sigma subunit)
LPNIAGWEFAARYIPATRGAEIGGDWYSVVEIDDDRFAVVVGDVSGHDMAAAGVMAALRYTIRTLAKLGIPPDEILIRSTKELDVITDHHLATVLVGVVDRRKQEITLASAGHPPPLMLREGQAGFLRVEPGAPLGVIGPRPKPTTVRFLPGSTLVAFTDGLIEQRGRPLDAGLQLLAATAAGGPAQSDDLINSLVAALMTTDQEDDLAVLAIRFLTREPDSQTADSSPFEPTSDAPAAASSRSA